MKLKSNVLVSVIMAVYNAEIDILDSKKDIYAKASASASQINIIFKITLLNIPTRLNKSDNLIKFSLIK